MSEKKQIKELDIPKMYVNSLSRAGFEYVEEIEEYLAKEGKSSLSKIIRNFGLKGDYIIEDALEFQRSGKHIDKPLYMLEMEQDYRIQKAVKQLNLEQKRKVADFTESLL